MTQTSKFRNLTALAVDSSLSREFPLVDVQLYAAGDDEPKTPVLRGVCVEGNKKYLAATSASNAQRARRRPTPQEIIAQGYRLAREHFPTCILTGWSNVYDSDGNAVEFSVESASDFLAALPNYILRDVIEFFGSPTNFRAADAVTQEEVDEAAGN